jgi:hypothetical protein
MARLPPNLPAAVLIVTHVPAGSNSRLPTILARGAQGPVERARSGEPIRRGRDRRTPVFGNGRAHSFRARIRERKPRRATHTSASADAATRTPRTRDVNDSAEPCRCFALAGDNILALALPVTGAADLQARSNRRPLTGGTAETEGGEHGILTPVTRAFSQSTPTAVPGS